MSAAAPFDVAVVGLGPAGRALAHRLLARGARVLAVDARPQRAWQQTFGGWQGELPGWLPGDVVGAEALVVVLRSAAEHRLPRAYQVLDTAALQHCLTLDGAELRTQVLDDEAMAGLAREARVVADCRGSVPLLAGGVGRRAVPAQTAFGVKLAAGEAAPLLQGADAVLMDWRPHDGHPAWGSRRASFCYLIPLPDGRVLAEETCLAGAPALGVAELQDRLRVRLGRHGITPATLAAAESEKVHIPLLAEPRAGFVPRTAVAFGAAGAQLNPISGYSVFASLAQADQAARSLLATGTLPEPPALARRLRRVALGAVLQLGGDATAALFDAFARLDEPHQRAVLGASSHAPELLAALGRQAWRMPPRHQLALVAATARGLPSSFHQPPAPSPTPGGPA